MAQRGGAVWAEGMRRQLKARGGDDIRGPFEGTSRSEAR